MTDYSADIIHYKNSSPYVTFPLPTLSLNKECIDLENAHIIRFLITGISCSIFIVPSNAVETFCKLILIYMLRCIYTTVQLSINCFFGTTG